MQARGGDEAKSSWADEVEHVAEEVIEKVEEVVDEFVPSVSEVYGNGYKIVTEYKRDEHGRKIKIVSTYKREIRMVPKSVAKRKTWTKFGASRDDKPGPNPATTITSEDIFMQFITSREEDKPDDDALKKLQTMTVKTIKCRTCNGDHWTLRCPYKDTSYIPTKEATPSTSDEKQSTTQAEDKGKMKCVAPGLRDGAGNKRGKSLGNQKYVDDPNAIRITNLPESTQEADLEELVKPFGDYNKYYLAKDKTTGLCKGFAFIHFKSRASAASAINALNGHGYDHLILGADWSKPHAHHT